MIDRYTDLLKQGFMRPPKRYKARTKRDPHQIAAEIAQATGQRVSFNGRYAVEHPQGHTNYCSTAKEARMLAEAQAD